MPAILDDATRAVVAGALDDLLLPADQGGLGKWCRLVYPPRAVPCANCVLDPIGNKSANRPRTGAPVPFTAGQPCPVCSGAGRIQTSATEDVVLGVNWNPKKFVLPIPASVDLRVPNAVCETKGFIALWPRLAKCDHLIVDLAVEGFSRQKFKLAGQPGSPGNIVQGRYVHAVWAMWNG
jgi:hypothetical protein